MLKQYLKKFLPFAIVIGLILAALPYLGDFSDIMPFAWLCYGLFFIMSIVTYYFSSKSMQGRFANFMNVFFAGIIAKLIITGIVVLLYKTSGADTKSLTFIIPFAIVYFSFLIFETLELVKLSNKSK